MTYEEFKETGLYKIAQAGEKATREGVERAKAMPASELQAQGLRNSLPYRRAARLAALNKTD